MQIDINEAKAKCPKLQVEKYYDKEVWTVNATDVEWIELEHYPKADVIQRLEDCLQELSNKLSLNSKKRKKLK